MLQEAGAPGQSSLICLQASLAPLQRLVRAGDGHVSVGNKKSRYRRLLTSGKAFEKMQLLSTEMVKHLAGVQVGKGVVQEFSF